MNSDLENLVVAPHTDGFELKLGDERLETEWGDPLVCERREVLDLVREHMLIQGSVRPLKLCPYNFFASQISHFDKGKDSLLVNFDTLWRSERCFYLNSGPEQVQQRSMIAFVEQFLDELGGYPLLNLPDSWQWREPVEEREDPNLRDWARQFGLFIDTIGSAVKNYCRGLHSSQRVVMFYFSLDRFHAARILLPLMLVTGRCSPREYAFGLCAVMQAHPDILERPAPGFSDGTLLGIDEPPVDLESFLRPVIATAQHAIDYVRAWQCNE